MEHMATEIACDMMHTLPEWRDYSFSQVMASVLMYLVSGGSEVVWQTGTAVGFGRGAA
jgi:hypothetical protein